ncbi:MAG: dienelactone hydrolase family protein [Pirellulales bacterium]|nr:dienelactone hydrolase family protein [Pirellulales bacterium]
MIMFTMRMLAAFAVVDSLLPGDHTRTLEVDGRSRTYLIHVPKSYDGAKFVPVVLAFHGGLTNADVMVRFSGLSEKADEAGFVVAYPNGTRRQGSLPTAPLLTWNAGNCCGYAALQQIDDTKFVGKVIDDLERIIKVDTKRVYATGISNGGMMCYRLADEMSDRIAAIAAVGGAMAQPSCAPRHPVPILHFHGTADEYAPFAGGRGSKSRSLAVFYSVEHTINQWVKANGCDKLPKIETLPATIDDGTNVIRKTYAGGRNESEFVLYEIQGGGHTWPGRPSIAFYLGKTTKNVSANDVMWTFFEKHSRQ